MSGEHGRLLKEWERLGRPTQHALLAGQRHDKLCSAARRTTKCPVGPGPPTNIADDKIMALTKLAVIYKGLVVSFSSSTPAINFAARSCHRSRKPRRSHGPCRAFRYSAITSVFDDVTLVTPHTHFRRKHCTPTENLDLISLSFFEEVAYSLTTSTSHHNPTFTEATCHCLDTSAEVKLLQRRAVSMKYIGKLNATAPAYDEEKHTRGHEDVVPLQSSSSSPSPPLSLSEPPEFLSSHAAAAATATAATASEIKTASPIRRSQSLESIVGTGSLNGRVQ